MFLGVLEVMDETDEMVVIEVMDDEMGRFLLLYDSVNHLKVPIL